MLRGFLQRKLRVLLTGIAIALGVALMAGTYMLTDTINNSFAAIFQTANQGHDVVDHADADARPSGALADLADHRSDARHVRATSGVAAGGRRDLHAGDVPGRPRQTPHDGRSAGVRRLGRCPPRSSPSQPSRVASR